MIFSGAALTSAKQIFENGYGEEKDIVKLYFLHIP